MVQKGNKKILGQLHIFGNSASAHTIKVEVRENLELGGIKLENNWGIYA